MPLYEHTFIARQDISNAQAEALIEQFGQILTDNGGKVVGTEYWGLRTLAYKINKNRKGHYAHIRSDAPASAVLEMERLMRLHEDISRVLTVRVEKHEEGPSAVIQARSHREERGERGDRGDRGPRGDRGDRGPRGPREGGFGDRGPRPDRGPREGGFGDRPPREGGFVPREGGFGDRPPREGGFVPREGGFGDRPPREGGFGDRGPRRD